MSTNVAISLCVYSNPTQTKYDINSNFTPIYTIYTTCKLYNFPI